MCNMEERSGNTHTHTHAHAHIYISHPPPPRSSKIRKVVLNLVDFVAAIADKHASTLCMEGFHCIMRHKYGDAEDERSYVRQIFNVVYM
jgi:hypothetical protein